MEESDKSKYFIDGFLLKHFQIWSFRDDKNDLFPEQKIFLVYLLASIPSIEDWTFDVEYRKKVAKIKAITTVKLSDEEIDIAKLQGKDIKEIRRERLKNEKLRLIRELNTKYGVIEDVETEIKTPEGLPEKSGEKSPIDLWKTLQGVGLVKNGL